MRLHEAGRAAMQKHEIVSDQSGTCYAFSWNHRWSTLRPTIPRVFVTSSCRIDKERYDREHQ